MILHFLPVEFLVQSTYSSHTFTNGNAVMGPTSQGVPMKDVYEVLQQKEADVANVRLEIQSLKLVSSLLSNESVLKDALELLRQKEAAIARVRFEIENLKIVAPLLSEESASDEWTETRADSAVAEARDSDDRSKATGTEGLFSSVVANPRPTFWKLLKRRT
jgi:hypothetical protein